MDEKHRLTCGSGSLLDSPAVHTPPSPVPLSLLASTLGPPESPLQGLHLLPAPGHLLQEAVLHQPGDLVHGSLEHGLHNTGQLGLKRYYGLSHCDGAVCDELS